MTADENLTNSLTPELYDSETGEKLSLSDDETRDAITSGRAAYLKGLEIPVVSPSGEIGKIPSENAAKAFSMGYRPQTTQELQDEKDKEEFGSGALNATKAFLAGAARGPTFGLSDQFLTKTGLVEPRTLSGLEKYQEGPSAAGEILGVSGALLAPELGAAKLLGEGGEAAGALARAANPVKAVSEAGKAVSEAATPLAEKLAGSLVSKETFPTVNKILSKGLATGAGSAVEGAAYGLGQSISEDALGDPDLNAEKVLANVGVTALFGGAIGSMIGGALAPFEKDVAAKATDNILTKAGQDIPSIKEARAASTDSFEVAVKESGLPDKEKASLIQGMSELKQNVGEIDEAAERLGVEAFPGQRSASEFVQNRYGMSTQSPSPFGVAEQQRIARATQAVSKQVDESLGTANAMSEAEFGNGLKKGISESVQPEIDQVNQAFDGIKAMTEGTPVSEKAINQISKNILKIDALVNAEGKPLSPSSPIWLFAERVANEVKNIKNLDDLKSFRTLLRQDTKGKLELRHIAGVIQEKLANLEISSIERLADQMKTQVAREKVLNLVDAMKSARVRYGQFMEKLSEIAEVGGKRKVWGPEDFIDFIDDITPEKLAKNMVKLAKGNSEKLAFVKDQFPEQFELLKSYIKSDIRQAAIKNGVLDVGAALKELEKLSPEAQAMLFSKEEFQVLKDARTWREAWGEKWGPSGTPKGIQYLDFFKNPFQAMGMTARDLAGLKFSHAFAGADSNAGKIAALVQLERAAQKQTKKIASGAKSVFQTTGALAVPIAVSGSAKEKKKENFDDLSANISEFASNPEKLIDTLDRSTQELYEVAPKMAGSLHSAAVRATSFLSAKLPKPPQTTLFSPKWTPNRAEVEKFNRYYSVVEDPTSVLHHVKNGTITPEAVETVRTVYPNLYHEMQKSVFDALTDHMSKKGSVIPFKTKQSLSVFLGQPLDTSMTQKSIQANQMSVSSQNTQPKAQPSKTGIGKLTLSTRMLTDMQSNTKRER